MKQARSALDAFGQATAVIRASDGRLLWQTPLARRLLRDYFAIEHDQAPPELLAWIAEARAAVGEQREPPVLVATATRRLLASLHDPSHLGHEGEWLLVLREEDLAAAMQTLAAAFKLTAREAEVLYWVSKGKTSKDIGDILGTSPRTVNKHLEHVFEKLGVETRTAAASLAMSKVAAGKAVEG
jgi:DNA-binding CsgD family transcriptional regulator